MVKNFGIMCFTASVFAFGKKLPRCIKHLFKVLSAALTKYHGRIRFW